ncbi:MAG: DUF4366 domain-containing protein [Flavonifractor plautii]|jgi:hypothetical protein|nr:DUF4366 domain-containing protein [Flavonifractor plautii]
MRKLKTRLFTSLLAVMLCCTALTPAAFAYAEDPEEVTSEEPVTWGVEPEPLTPEGNLTIVDDIEGEAAGDKQFIIVQTKGGNTFYIIVDRAADGENTVYFLNAVDEADLLALMEDGEPAACSCTEKCAAGAVNTACPVCAVNMTECAGKEPEPTPEPEETPEPEKEAGGLNPAVLLVVLVLLGGGGALAYFKLVKGKQASTRGSADLDDYDYGEDEGDADVELDKPETEDEEL